MADETNRDEELRGAFSKLRQRVKETLRSKSSAAPDDASKNSGPAPEPAARQQQPSAGSEPTQHQGMTQEQMDAAKLRFQGEKFRLQSAAWDRQRQDDYMMWERKHEYGASKSLARAENLIGALKGEARAIPFEETNNRPGEKFMLRRTKGMAKAMKPDPMSGPSP